MDITHSVDHLFQIIRLKPLRKTPGVTFDILPKELVAAASSVDRVIHQKAAVSPGPTEGVKRPWYMHTHQSDNLLVFYGTRSVSLYTPAHGKIENFVVTPEHILHEGTLLADGPAMLVWPPHVFHRVESGDSGSASANFAIHHDGFDIKTNFNIYNVDTRSGTFSVLRAGHRDQFHLGKEDE